MFLPESEQPMREMTFHASTSTNQLASHMAREASIYQTPVHTVLGVLELTVYPGETTDVILKRIDAISATPEYKAAYKAWQAQASVRRYLRERFEQLTAPVNWARVATHEPSHIARFLEDRIWLLVCHHLWMQTATWPNDRRLPFLDALVGSEFQPSLLVEPAAQAGVDLRAITKQYTDEVEAALAAAS